jgi:uncharacterized iron-regulated protein
MMSFPRSALAVARTASPLAALLAVTATFATLGTLATGCGGKYAGKATTPGDHRGVEAAGMPYTILDARTGHQVDEATFWARLGGSSAVCVGEEHPNPHHHWVQLKVVGELASHGGPTLKLALGMEMFQRPFQGVLDDFAAKRIDEAALRSRAGWEDRWGYDYALYRPVIARAVAAGGALVALNAAKELVKKITHQGLDALSPAEHAQVPELNLADAAHRAWFDAVMSDMGGGAAHATAAHDKDKGDDKDKPAEEPAKAEAAPEPAAPAMPSADRVYMIQVLWDETMADTAASWLKATPGGHIVILAGAGHCHDSAIVGRMKRRGVTDALSIRTVVDLDDGAVAEALAKPMNDFLVVLTPPPALKAELKKEAESN